MKATERMPSELPWRVQISARASATLSAPEAFRRDLALAELERYALLLTGKTLNQGNSAAALTIELQLSPLEKGAADDAFDLRGAPTPSPSVTIQAGTTLGLLYGVYRFVEKLGVGFRLDGDVIAADRAPLAWATLAETARPLFAVRGLNPWGSHPFGFDLWDAAQFRVVLRQMAKLRLNFIGMHCYLSEPYDEPNVWVGLAEDVHPDGSVRRAYPSRLYTTAVDGFWGPIPAAPTNGHALGADRLFAGPVWGAPRMAGLAPQPATEAQSIELFNRSGILWREVAATAHELGVSFCLGTEMPLLKFLPAALKARLLEAGLDPASPEARRRLYEGIFTRIKRAHGLDYYWLWTPEAWAWKGNDPASAAAAAEDVAVATAAARAVGLKVRFATAGWVLGPQGDRAAFDPLIPRDVIMSAISRQVGRAPLDPAFGALRGRPTWAMPWIEDDWTQNSPQFWPARLHKDAADALAYGAEGWIGLLWRTRETGASLLAFAHAAWTQPWNPAPGKILANTLNPADWHAPDDSAVRCSGALAFDVLRALP
jgi:hypothetical protein